MKLVWSKDTQTNLIATLTHCAYKICSKSSLQQKLDTIRYLFLKNGYPESVINARISKKILQFQKHSIGGPQRCPVYLKLPWIGETSVIFERKIKIVFQQFNRELFSQPDEFFLQFTKTFCLLLNKAWLYINTCAAANAGTWAELLNVCRTESAKMSRKLSATKPIKKEFSQREKVK